MERREIVEGVSRSALIQRYVAEGIELDDHSGIVFRSGPSGRHPGSIGGPDVWQVVAVFRRFGDIQRIAEWLDLAAGTIDTALGYYDAHRDEIDAWIRRNEEAADAAERVAWARMAVP